MYTYTYIIIHYNIYCSAIYSSYIARLALITEYANASYGMARLYSNDYDIYIVISYSIMYARTNI